MVDIESDGYYNFIDSYLEFYEIGIRAVAPRSRSKFYWELADYKGIDWSEAWAES